MIIEKEEFSKYPKHFKANFINSLSGFKSLNLIGSINTKKQENLAIINSVVHLGADPALIGFISRPDSVRKDTLENIREIKDFTINNINEKMIRRAHQTSARYEKDESEFDYCDINKEYLNGFSAPFVQESQLKIAVRYLTEKRVEINNTILVIAEIVFIDLAKDCVLDDGVIAIEELGSLCGSSLNGYHRTELIERLSYAKVGAPPKKI